jgi:pre-mRNA-splicing factor SYF1
VKLRQNPHNVQVWLERILLTKKQYPNEPEKIIKSFSEAVKTIDPQKATEGFHTIWITFAQFYEDFDDLVNARVIYQKASFINYKDLKSLVEIWTNYAEMELRHKQFSKARAVLKDAISMLI